MDEREKQIVCYPASMIQRQFWLGHQLQPETSAHNIPAVFHVRGDLKIEILNSALKYIINQQEIFRTYFEMRDGELTQCVLPSVSEIVIEIEDWTGEKAVFAPSDAQMVLQETINKSFNLSKWPLMRFKVLRISHNEFILMIVMHHIITDLHTKDLFSYDLSRCYNAVAREEATSTQWSGSQYGDYAQWHKDWLNSADAEKMADYWQKELEGCSQYLRLPLDKTRPNVQTLNGNGKRITIPKDLTKALRQFSKECNTGIFITLLTAYGILLSRYSGQDQLTVGVPLTNRRRESDKNTYGCFVNIMPIRIDCDAGLKFDELQQQIRQRMLGAHRNQEIPIQKIIETVKPQRDMSYNPIFQTGFTFEPPMELCLEDLDVQSISVHTTGSQLDFFMTLWETDETIEGFLEFNTDLFKQGTIDRFGENFITLLKNVVQDHSSSIETLPILSKFEYQRIVLEWNDTKKEYPHYDGIHQLFEMQVERSPDAIALEFEGKALTYKALNEKCNQLAHYLREQKIGPDMCVGIMMERSLEMVIAIYAIVKAGGAYLPLDPEYPDKRLEYMIGNANIPLVLTQGHLTQKLANLSTAFLALDTDWQTIADRPTENPEINITPYNNAYMIFTSGSTGQPKGVMNAHIGIINRILWMQETYLLDEKDIVLQKTPFTFDVSVWEFFWPLMAGAKLLIAPPQSHRDPEQLSQLIRDAGVTTLHFVPSMLQLFIDNTDLAASRCVKRIICSGEALPYDLKEKFCQHFDAELHNLYGPTEAAVDVTSFVCRPDKVMKIVPIGKPIANTSIYILDGQLQPVPIGVAGELHIGGVQVARGYLNQPELTREKFIKDPFSADHEARLYKSGDLARFLEDGNIEYLGRIDNQVKIRGLRIELGEIENALVEHPCIQIAAVVVKHFSAGDDRIIAYISLDKINAHTVRKIKTPERDSDSGSESLVEDVRQYLRERLPDYMVPSVFIVLDEMPLSSNGKIDRKSLPEPDIKRTSVKRTFIPPYSEQQKVISDMWCRLLKIDQVGIDEHFFDIGGNSFLAVQLVSMLKTELGKEVPVVQIFEYPTIKTLAAFLYQGSDEKRFMETAMQRSKMRKESLKKRSQRNLYKI